MTLGDSWLLAFYGRQNSSKLAPESTVSNLLIIKFKSLIYQIYQFNLSESHWSAVETVKLYHSQPVFMFVSHVTYKSGYI